MKKFNVGFIGLGGRGCGLINGILLDMERITVVAICDTYQDRCDDEATHIEEKTGNRPYTTTNYHELTTCDDIDVIVIATSWETHIEIALSAMENKKAVAMEVGGAYDLDDCWKLVDTYEKTKTPFMFLENCCFGKREMMVLNMKELGVLGEIVHCSGGYQHDLRHEITFGKENRHYRLRNYLNRNCENYPTHDLGPIAKVLNINDGNRLLTLSSTASKSAGLHEYIKANKGDDTELLNANFAQGDIVTTVLKCTGGETIVLTLDTTLPRYYSRNFTVRGTKGMYEESTDSIFFDREEDIKLDLDWKSQFGNADKYAEEYNHPVWKQYEKTGVCGSHDGMDWLEFKIFFDCLEFDRPMPVNVYDAAVFMSISTLSEYSVAKGGAVMDIPDFTRGKWIKK